MAYFISNKPPPVGGLFYYISIIVIKEVRNINKKKYLTLIAVVILVVIPILLTLMKPTFFTSKWLKVDKSTTSLVSPVIQDCQFILTDLEGNEVDITPYIQEAISNYHSELREAAIVSLAKLTDEEVQNNQESLSIYAYNKLKLSNKTSSDRNQFEEFDNLLKKQIQTKFRILITNKKVE